MCNFVLFRYLESWRCVSNVSCFCMMEACSSIVQKCKRKLPVLIVMIVYFGMLLLTVYLVSHLVLSIVLLVKSRIPIRINLLSFDIFMFWMTWFIKLTLLTSSCFLIFKKRNNIIMFQELYQTSY